MALISGYSHWRDYWCCGISCRWFCFQSIALAAQSGTFNVLGGFAFAFLTLFLIYFIAVTWFGLFGARLGTLAILNQPLTAGDAMRRGFSRLASGILVSLIFFVVLGAIYFITFFGFAIIVAAIANAVGVILAIIWGIAGLAAMFFLMVAWSIVTPLMVNEGMGLSALGQSWTQTKGKRAVFFFTLSFYS